VQEAGSSMRRAAWGLAAAIAWAAWGLAAAIAWGAWAGASAEPAEDAITFVGRNSLVEANGHFGRWRVSGAEVDPTDLAASFVEVEIEVASLDTGIALRDDHLRSPDFFEVARWPTATVRVRDARPDGADEQGRPRYRARFDIRIRDVEKTLEGTFARVGENGVEGSLTLDRTEWGIGSPRSRWNPLSVHDEVVVRYRARLPAPTAELSLPAR